MTSLNKSVDADAVNAALATLRSSTGDLVTALTAATWTDEDAAASTLLPGWTRGHVLTHISRNADAIGRTLAGALRGEVVARYPDGPAGRDADIDKGATRPISELIADVSNSAERLDRVVAAVHDADAWGAPTDDERPAWAWLHARVDEVEIHRVDLTAGYTADRWPAPMIVRDLPRLAATLSDRCPGAVRVEIEEDGSVAADHVGAVWTSGNGDAIDVRGPDWAVLAWLLGRPQAALGRLTAMPELSAWR